MIRYMLSFPVLLFPYTLLGALYLLLSCSAVMDRVFMGNAYLLLGALLGYGILAFVCAVAVALLTLACRTDAHAAARLNLIVKLCQVPAYVVIFVLGLLFLITVLGMMFALFFMLFDCLAIAMTGLIGAAASLRGAAQKKNGRGLSVLLGLFQFVFVADLAAAVALFFATRNSVRKQRIQSANEEAVRKG